jgi:uncharacterized protein YecE (DUF72 family)
MPGRTHVGISGWTYAGWRRVFYPEGLPRRRELEYVASQMGTVEINGSFYSLQRPTSYRAWYEQTPPGFVFAVKGSRFITHMLKLKNAEAALANFFASGVLRLADKLGPILWQFPERMQFNEEKFAPCRFCPGRTRTPRGSRSGTTTACWGVRGRMRSTRGPSATPSRSATPAFCRSGSSTCCAPTTPRWSLPTPPAAGPTPRT